MTSIISVVRMNLLTRDGYTPYCGADRCSQGRPRSTFNDKQFKCACGWQSSFEPEFIDQYKTAQEQFAHEMLNTRDRLNELCDQAEIHEERKWDKWDKWDNEQTPTGRTSWESPDPFDIEHYEGY